MPTDLTGGLDPAREYVFTEPQTTPGMQEGVNWWLWDDAGQFGMPRFAVEAVAPNWETPEIHLSLVEPDGQLMRNWTSAPAHPVIGPSGKATHFGAGPLQFDCLEPLRRYRAAYDGDAMIGSFEEMAGPGFSTDKRAPLKFEFECETSVPPWVQGSMSPDASQRMASGTVEGEFMGGERLEQLCRVKGRISIRGGAERSFTGGCLRIRRQGVRKISGFWGHCWQSAQFPSGKAFGYIAYPPRPDGQPSYNEGYIFLGEGELIPARVAEAPWLTGFRFSGEDVGLVLETAKGRIRIEGESFGGMPTIGGLGTEFPPLFQSIARYRWDGEAAYGMMERSNLREKVALG